MNLLTKLTFAVCCLTALSGCGGSGGGGDESVPSRIDIIAEAPTHGEGQGISQLTGFVDGDPAFLSYTDATRWTIWIPGIDTVDLPTTAFDNAYLIAFENGLVLGGYDDGLFVYRKVGLNWVATTYTGVAEAVLDGVTGTLIGKKGGGFVTVDIESGSETPLPIPVGSSLLMAKANWLVYGSGSSFFVRNLSTAAEWDLEPVAGDTGQFPYALNESGGVIGNSGDGATGRAIYWAPGTGASTVIDSYAGGTVEPGWVSPDGTKAIVNVFTDVFRSYLYVNGVKYTAADLENGNVVSYLHGFDDEGKLGFGLTDSSGDPESSVAVKVTYQ